jgi:prolyl-tRNA editing enzyme YbaK/EbsC (Cys-tRNA(Pro) deacylase)
MQVGSLDFIPVEERLDLVAVPVANALSTGRNDVYVSAIDPTLSDTVEFCAAYGVGLDISANCVILEAKRADKEWYVACMILATDRADVNGVIRRHLDARKISFAHMEEATSLSKMEYGGITPIGLPIDWPILVDERVIKAEYVIIGAGIRGAKLLVPGKFLAGLPNVTALGLAKQPDA